LLGQLRLGPFKLSPVIGVLIAGMAVGQIGIAEPAALQSAFFLLFLFSVGYKTGPQFFRGLGRGALPQLILAVLLCTTGLASTYAIAKLLKFDAGTAAGLLAGSLNASAAIGTANDAIQKLGISEHLRRALTTDVAVAFAVTYLIGLFTTIFVLVRLAPWFMRVDLRAECKKLEHELGMDNPEQGVVSAYRQFAIRCYEIPEELPYKTVAEIENAFLPERVFVERVKTNHGTSDADSDGHLLPGNIVVLSGRSKVLAGGNNPLQSYEIDDEALLDIPTVTVNYVLNRKDLAHRTLAELARTLEEEVPTRGVFVRKITRAGAELPIGPEVVLERGDLLTLIGAARHVERVAARLGPVQRPSVTSDLAVLCLAIAFGGFIGLPALRLSGFDLGLSLPVGVLLGGLVVGWLQSVRPLFARIPEPAVWLLDSLGLSGFLAAVAIGAGPNFIYGIRTSGLVLVVSGILVSAIPNIVTVVIGRYLFRLHPGILLGICAGGGTSPVALAALQEAADSRVPVLGYGVSYAVGNVVLALWGAIIIALMHRSS
jgi:putative transport protein